MSQPVAIVVTEVFLRRLTPSLASFAGRVQDYRILSVHRKLKELQQLIEQINPRGLILEKLPKRGELLGLAGEVPTILLATDDQHKGCISLDVDDWAVGKEAADTFLSGGFKSLACLGNGTPYSAQRIDGFKEAGQRWGCQFLPLLKKGLMIPVTANLSVLRVRSFSSGCGNCPSLRVSLRCMIPWADFFAGAVLSWVLKFHTKLQ